MEVSKVKPNEVKGNYHKKKISDARYKPCISNKAHKNWIALNEVLLTMASAFGESFSNFSQSFYFYSFFFSFHWN